MREKVKDYSRRKVQNGQSRSMREVKDYSRRKAQNGQAKKLHKKTQTFTIIASHSREIKQLPFNICGTRRAFGCGEKGKMLYSLKVALRVLDPQGS